MDIEETWKKIENSKNYYISSLGRLKKEESIIWCEYNKSQSRLKERIYNFENFNENQYVRFCIRYENDNKKIESIHRIIATYFIPNPDNKPYINHKNGKKNDNRAVNLEWCTHQENMQHRYKVLKRFGNRRGKDCHLTILTEDQVRFIPVLLQKGFSIKQVSKIMNVSPNTIGEIKSGRSWKHLNLNFLTIRR